MCGLEFEGREHSGIDDAKNIARVILSCLKKGFAFHEGHVLTHNYQTGSYAGVDQFPYRKTEKLKSLKHPRTVHSTHAQEEEKKQKHSCDPKEEEKIEKSTSVEVSSQHIQRETGDRPETEKHKEHEQSVFSMCSSFVESTLQEKNPSSSTHLKKDDWLGLMNVMEKNLQADQKKEIEKPEGKKKTKKKKKNKKQ